MPLKPTLRRATELGFALTAIATLILAGCGGGGDAGSSGGSTAATTSATVIPYKGQYYSGAAVTLKDANGAAVGLSAGGTVNASGVVSITYPASVTYPLIVEVSGSYYNENTNAAETGSTPLRGLIVNAASNVPVTLVTEAAVADLQNRLGGSFSSANPIQAASAVAALNVAGTILGVPASAVPAFNAATHQTSDGNTLLLSAWAVVANGQSGTDLAAKARALANSLASLNPASAPTAVLNQTALNNALNVMVNGNASVSAVWGATPGAAPAAPTIPSASYGSIYASAVGAPGTGGGGGGTVTPAITGFSPASGVVGTNVTISGTHLDSFTPSPLVKFGTTTATVSVVTGTSVTVAVPASLAAGNSLITMTNGDGTGVTTVGTFEVTAPVVVPASTSCVATLSYYGGNLQAPVCFINLPANFACDQASLSAPLAPYMTAYSNTTPTISYAAQSACPGGAVDTVGMGGTTSGNGSALKTASWDAAVGLQTTGKQIVGQKMALSKVKFDGAGNAFAFWLRSNGYPPGSMVPTFSLVASRYSAASGTWGAEQVVSGADNVSPYGSQNVTTSTIVGVEGYDFAVNAAGDAVAVWRGAMTDSSGNYNIKAARYFAATNTWGGVANLQAPSAGANMASFPRVAIDAAGTAIVMWQQPPGMYASVSSLNGAWSRTAIASAAWGTATLKFDSAGNAVAIWNSQLTTPSFSYEVKALRYNGTSKTWGAVTTLHGTPTSASYYGGAPALDFDSTGNALAVWVESNGTGTLLNVFAAYMNAAGGAWSTPVQLDSFAGSDASTSKTKVRFDASGNATAAWSSVARTLGGQQVDLVATRFTAASQTWSALAGTNLGSYGTSNAYDIDGYKIDAGGNVFAIGANHPQFSVSMGAKGAQMARFDAASGKWKPVPSNLIGLGAQMDFDADGNAVVVWAGFSAVYNAGNNTWSNPQSPQQAFSVSPSLYPTVSMGANGKAIALWLGGTGANLIYGRTITLQ